MPSTKIFILASERSGTNLLRILINNHHLISAPVAPHFFDVFYNLIKYYAPLKNKRNGQQLLKDALALANHPYHDWALPEETLASESVDSLTDCIDQLYRAKAALEDKSGYCSKGIHNFNYAHYIKEAIPEAKFVYLVRDPRDHVASWLRTPLYLHTPYQVISKWNAEQDQCLNLEEIYRQDFIRIRYEDLIADTIETMSKVQHFLGLPIDENCFSTSGDNKEAERNELWRNLSKPIISDNKKKYLKTLKPYQLRIIESVAKENMIELGYTDFETPADWQINNSVVFKVEELLRTMYSQKVKVAKNSQALKGIQSKNALLQSIRKRLKEQYHDSSD